MCDPYVVFCMSFSFSQNFVNTKMSSESLQHKLLTLLAVLERVVISVLLLKGLVWILQGGLLGSCMLFCVRVEVNEYLED